MTGPVRRIPRQRAGDQGRRGWLRSWWSDWGQLLTGAWLIILTGGFFTLAAVGYSEQHANSRQALDLIERLNLERLNNTVTACISDSSQNAATIEYLRIRRVDRDALRDARRLFPVLSDAECRALAHEQVDTRGP